MRSNSLRACLASVGRGTGLTGETILRHGPLGSPAVPERSGRGEALAVIAQWLRHGGSVAVCPARAARQFEQLPIAFMLRGPRCRRPWPRSSVTRSPSCTTQAVPARPCHSLRRASERWSQRRGLHAQTGAPAEHRSGTPSYRPPNKSLEETAPAAFTSARCARPRFGLRVLLLSSKPLAARETRARIQSE